MTVNITTCEMSGVRGRQHGVQCTFPCSGTVVNCEMGDMLIGPVKLDPRASEEGGQPITRLGYLIGGKSAFPLLPVHPRMPPIHGGFSRDLCVHLASVTVVFSLVSDIVVSARHVPVSPWGGVYVQWESIQPICCACAVEGIASIGYCVQHPVK